MNSTHTEIRHPLRVADRHAELLRERDAHISALISRGRTRREEAAEIRALYDRLLHENGYVGAPRCTLSRETTEEIRETTEEIRAEQDMDAGA